MNKLKKLIFNENSPFILGGAFILVGLLILLFPATSLKTVSRAIGVLITINGATKLCKYIKENNDDNGSFGDLLSAVLSLLGALFLILRPQKFVSIIPVLIGVGIVVYGIFSLLSKKSSVFSKICSALTIALGLAIIGSPFAFAQAVTSIIGIALIILGVLSIIKQNRINKLQNLLNPSDGYTEVDFTDVDE